ncbi:DUF6476 family protein [Roseovarius aestuarii]|uniref:DUF6476 family protein n=1 Tax=Roseovarius aestuarii TaxID=475083 RepID=UPI000A26C917|nr:DUF6476 family protein [Roseovarius aestuarii]
MNNSPETQPVDPALVKYLRILVTVLTVTMILGFIVIVVLFVTKFSDAFSADLPDVITLPDGSVATAFTQGKGWYAVVTDGNKILIYNQKTGDLSQTIAIEH